MSDMPADAENIFKCLVAELRSASNEGRTPNLYTEEIIQLANQPAYWAKFVRLYTDIDDDEQMNTIKNSLFLISENLKLSSNNDEARATLLQISTIAPAVTIISGATGYLVTTVSGAAGAAGATSIGVAAIIVPAIAIGISITMLGALVWRFYRSKVRSSTKRRDAEAVGRLVKRLEGVLK